MKQELLKVEFRYRSIPKTEYDSSYNSKTIVIGIYKTLDKAVEVGNRIIKTINEKLDYKSKICGELSSKGYIPIRIATNYSGQCGIFVTIETLNYEDLNATIDKVLEIQGKYDKWNNSIKD